MNKKEELAKVFHYDLYGKRDTKYEFLNNRSIRDVKWDGLERKEPQYFFVKKDFSLEVEYSKGIKVDDLFHSRTIGIATGRDSELISFDKEALLERYPNTQSCIFNIAYRPYDYPFVPFDNKLLQRARYNLMSNMIRDNLSLNIAIYAKNNWSQTLISNNIIGKHFVTDQTYAFPLYLYTDTQLDPTARQPNLNLKVVEEIANKLEFEFIQDHKHADSSKEGTFNPLDILDYIYAILHSPTYRERYKEFLKIDFPRIPFTSDQKLFWSLVKKGRELREYHLMEHINSSKLITKFPITGENEITQFPKFDGSKVWINETQYFDKVPQIAWEFYIGGYQPAQKWLKDRKGRKLSFDEVLHYQKIIVALVNTDRVMKEIDKLIPKWPVR